MAALAAAASVGSKESGITVISLRGGTNNSMQGLARLRVLNGGSHCVLGTDGFWPGCRSSVHDLIASSALFRIDFTL
jgi:hypothetical protein